MRILSGIVTLSLRALQFYICNFEVNRDRKTRCPNTWSNLILKCNANTFVKVDAQIEENCRRTISYTSIYFILFICMGVQSRLPAFQP